MPAPAPFPIQPDLTAIAIAYRNGKMVADEVLPRVPVGKQDFKYLLHNLADGFTIPDTAVGRKSQPNQVEFTATEVTASTEDHALDAMVPQADIANAPVNYNPLGRAVEGVQNLIALDREVRVSNLVFGAANYAATNKVTLSGASLFTDPTSNPQALIQDAADSMILRPNVMVLGRRAFTVLSRHPAIVKAFHGNAGDGGVASRQFIADLFEMDKVIVGEARVNTARKGQAATLARAWGNHIALLVQDSHSDTMSGTATFGLTAQFGDRVAGAMPNPNIGMRGGQQVRSGESVKELITAPDLGYLIQNVG
jgi:hypothetical protein